MQYTESITSCPKGRDEAALSEVDVQTVLEQVTDPRRKQGRRFRIASILVLALAAMLSNHVSELAIAQWGAAQSDETKKALGCAERRHPTSNDHSTSLSPIKCSRGRSRFSQYFSANL